MKKIEIFDTTLRDGSQMIGVNFSLEDKIKIAKKMDDIGIDFLECGWPSSNPKDYEFFKEIKKCKLKHSKIVAFGSTAYYKNEVKDDKNLNTIIEVEPDVANIFGKSWDLHVTDIFGITLEKNLEIVYESVKYLKENVKDVFFTAEHFFDGYKRNKGYALSVLKEAEKAGATRIILADTNGGQHYLEIKDIIKDVKENISVEIGVHFHNDSAMATVNSIESVLAGAIQVHGTINGYGERCGNANLCEIIPILQLKMDYDILGDNIKKLTQLSKYVSELSNFAHEVRMPFVGTNAFAHKGGVHVSAIMKNTQSYEHMSPENVGNKRVVSISDLSGKSNIKYKLKEFDLDITLNDDEITKVIKAVKSKVNEGYEYEGAEASFELLVQRELDKKVDFINVKSFRIISEENYGLREVSEGTVKLEIEGNEYYTVAEGNGPVDALTRALKKALLHEYPELEKVTLSDYKVRILNSEATQSLVRVLVESRDSETGEEWSTVGVSTNIIKASWEALVDMFNYYLYNKYEKHKN
ncbi:MAG: 2-isopropylmalate synthase [Fusobacteriaceae bacterium]|jgi:2-isopropylmalate synthase|nr:alpha-isopropylmalate/homocitrate synthase family transferase [Fusobacteriales bacterium]MDN5304851.1 2-isopropylmalate synthase [Fusobacteriaceae bacterium]